jgi:membrane-associated HD superfamily phosphohydrolase
MIEHPSRSVRQPTRADRPAPVAQAKSRRRSAGCNRIPDDCLSSPKQAVRLHPGETTMDFALLIPIVMFICIVMAIKIVVEARFKRRLTETNASEDLIRAMLLAEEQSRRVSALKWGIVLTLIGLSFGLIDALNLDAESAATWGLLIGAAGVGMLSFHVIASRKS